MEQVLPFKKVTYDHSVEQTGDISNMSAEEYISWVRDQAASLPDVTRADVDLSLYSTSRTNCIPFVEDAYLCSEDMLPSEDWENDCVKDFSDLRLYITSLSEDDVIRERKVAVPQLKDKNAWNKFCFGVEYIEAEVSSDSFSKKFLLNDDIQLKKKLLLTQVLDCASDDGNKSDDSDDGRSEENAIGRAISSTLWHGLANVSPSLSLMLQMDHVMTQRVLKYQVEWLESECILTSQRTFWIYALLSRIEKPLHKDAVFLIRKLYKNCSKLRSLIKEDDVSLPDLNLLITITGIYFGQRNLY